MSVEKWKNGRTIVRCDNCGIFAPNAFGEYVYKDGTAGYILQEYGCKHDFCNQCSEKLGESCPKCGQQT